MRGFGGGAEEAGRLRVRLLAALALLVLAASAFAQTKSPLPINDLAGERQGQWTSPSGYLFAATLSLKVAPDGTADGQVVWTLKRSPLAEEQRKLGMSATEFVSGKVDSAAGTVTLAGVSGNLGEWDGLVFLQR